MMDFDQAISAHSAWKRKLAEYLKKPDHSLKAAEVAMDNKCDLGKWIADGGAKYSSSPEFGRLKSEHARFHKAAADVVRRADSGKVATEDTVLGSKSEFMSASSSVVQAIVAMKANA